MSGSLGRRARARAVLTVLRRTTSALAVVILVGAALPISAGASSASPADVPSVTVTADPPSGSAVHPGDSITYTLSVVSPEPLQAGARVVADLSGLLDHANVLSTAGELADGALTLDPQARTLTWDVPAAAEGADGSDATTSFRVAVADTATDGTQLITAAAAAGNTCAPETPCAATLTVTRPPDTSAALSATETPESQASEAPASLPERVEALEPDAAPDLLTETTTPADPAGTEESATSATDEPDVTTEPDSDTATDTATTPDSGPPATSGPATTAAESAGTDETADSATSGPVTDAPTSADSPTDRRGSGGGCRAGRAVYGRGPGRGLTGRRIRDRRQPVHRHPGKHRLGHRRRDGCRRRRR